MRKPAAKGLAIPAIVTLAFATAIAGTVVPAMAGGGMVIGGPADGSILPPSE